MNNFDPYSVKLYLLNDRKIEMTPTDVHLTLALLIGARKVKEFIRRIQTTLNTIVVILASRKEWNIEDGTSKLSKMLQYTMSQTDAREIFKRKFLLYMVLLFFNGMKNIHCAPYFA